MQPQGLLVQQVAQGAVKIPETEVGTEGHQGLGRVGRHAGGRQVATLGRLGVPNTHKIIGRATAWEGEERREAK